MHFSALTAMGGHHPGILF